MKEKKIKLLLGVINIVSDCLILAVAFWESGFFALLFGNRFDINNYQSLFRSLGIINRADPFSGIDMDTQFKIAGYSFTTDLILSILIGFLGFFILKSMSLMVYSKLKINLQYGQGVLDKKDSLPRISFRKF